MIEASSKPYRRGVGIMLLAPDRRIFVGRRIDTPGAWQMPQGGIDKGETPREAALRELHEEVGTDNAEILAETKDWLTYELPGDLHLQAWGGRYRGQQQKWFAMRFLGKDSDIRLDAHEPEFDAWKWVTREELLRDIVPFKRQLYEDALKEFAPLFAEG
ncbi:MAG TPA: RNA pyrophosphohydrolase [Stellaceae bacterium]|jgi:putative (di)nucleoside polyphosphate hydrolase|nr:RNA pyrophosphohydrolase [Stellaceae bacterium]